MGDFSMGDFRRGLPNLTSNTLDFMSLFRLLGLYASPQGLGMLFFSNVNFLAGWPKLLKIDVNSKLTSTQNWRNCQARGGEKKIYVKTTSKLKTITYYSVLYMLYSPLRQFGVDVNFT